MDNRFRTDRLQLPALLISASLLTVVLLAVAPASRASGPTLAIQQNQALPAEISIQITENSGQRDMPGEQPSISQQIADSSHYYHHLLPAPFISDISLKLWEDHDANGFYSRFQLTFDVASDYYHHAVFARVYLRAEGDTYRLFHTTAAFPIRAWPLTDYYEMDARLLSHYHRDWYDIRIELYDKTTGTLYDTLDAHSHHRLFNIPLEATGRSHHSDVDVVIHATAGAIDTHVAMLLLLLAAWRSRQLINK